MSSACASYDSRVVIVSLVAGSLELEAEAMTALPWTPVDGGVFPHPIMATPIKATEIIANSPQTGATHLIGNERFMCEGSSAPDGLERNNPLSGIVPRAAGFVYKILCVCGGISALSVIGVMVSGCVPAASPTDGQNTAAGQVTLYDRMGGGPAIYAIVDQLVEQLLNDPRVNFVRSGHPHAWANTPDSVAQLKTYWAQYFGVMTDGPQVYEGQDLLQVHTGMGISEAEWVAFLEDLKQTLDHFSVDADLQKQFLTRVAATHDAIVAR